MLAAGRWCTGSGQDRTDPGGANRPDERRAVRAAHWHSVHGSAAERGSAPLCDAGIAFATSAFRGRHAGDCNRGREITLHRTIRAITPSGRPGVARRRAYRPNALGAALRQIARLSWIGWSRPAFVLARESVALLVLARSGSETRVLLSLLERSHSLPAACVVAPSLMRSR
jgi:hypothetical protein